MDVDLFGLIDDASILHENLTEPRAQEDRTEELQLHAQPCHYNTFFSNDCYYTSSTNRDGHNDNLCSFVLDFVNGETMPTASVSTMTPTSSSTVNTAQTSSSCSLRRRRGRPQNADVDPNEPCHVCLSARAGQHLHYGGRVCKACKAFFRRAVKHRLLSKFKCVDGKNECGVSATANRCQYCRFQRCLRVGMRVSWVAPDEARVVLPPISSLAKQSAPVSSEEVAQITNTLRVLQLLSGHSFYRFLVQKSNPLMLQLVRHGFFGGVMAYELSEHFLNMFRCLIHFVMLDELQGISTHDRARLVEHNAPLLGVFKSCIVMTERDSCLSKELCEVTDYIWQREGLQPQEKLRIDSLRRERGLRPAIAYEQVFASPWAANVDDEVRHWNLTSQIGNWPSTTSEQGDTTVDHLQVAMMKLVIGTNTESVQPLENRSLCDSLQARFLTMLQRYLRFKFGVDNGRRRLMEGLNVISLVREAHEIRQRRLRI